MEVANQTKHCVHEVRLSVDGSWQGGGLHRGSQGRNGSMSGHEGAPTCARRRHRDKCMYSYLRVSFRMRLSMVEIALLTQLSWVQAVEDLILPVIYIAGPQSGVGSSPRTVLIPLLWWVPTFTSVSCALLIGCSIATLLTCILCAAVAWLRLRICVRLFWGIRHRALCLGVRGIWLLLISVEIELVGV
jgi:hypothetical protein